MSADQINELRDTFRRAMLEWDVPVSVIIDDDYATVSFTLWSTPFEDCFTFEKGTWSTTDDCPHHIEDSVTVWQWIAMQLHEKIKP